MPFPTLDELSGIIDRTTGVQTADAKPVLDGAALIAMQQTVRQVLLAEPVKRYALRLVLASHPDIGGSSEAARAWVRFGASPRGAQSIILLARVFALLDGRAQVSFDDVRRATLPALRHRLILSYEAEGEGLGADDVIARILDDVPTQTGAVAAAAGLRA